MRIHRSLAPRGALAWTVALAVAVFAACSDQAPVEPAPDAELSVQEVDPALAAQEAHTPELMSRDNVVGTAVGRTADGRPAIVLYLLQGGPNDLPDHIEGIPVVQVVTGMFVAGSDPTARRRPAPVGFSVGHPDITAGTYGARVTNGTDVFMLSNNHVLADINRASIGDPTLQPGPSDGGSDPEDRIAVLSDFQPIDFENQNTIDAAIAEPLHPDSISASTPTDDAYGAPNSTVFDLDGDGDGSVDSGVVGLAVQKYGRTTELTQGEVSEINVTAEVCYVCANPVCTRCAESATMVDQIGITPGDFSGGGDSGSLIVTDDANVNPVGLLFAGSSSRTLANRIDLVLDRFGVSVDGGGGGDGGDTNSPPTASFTSGCTDLTCDFDGSGSSDSDGTVVSHEWDFGDGTPTESGETVTHAYDTGGDYTVTLTVTDDDGATGSDSQTVTVSESTAALDVTGIDPGSMAAGSTVDVTVAGTGFVDGADVSLENGSGPAPSVSNVAFVDETTLTATFSSKSGGPPRDRVWDVRVTNPDGSSDVLPAGFTVTP